MAQCNYFPNHTQILVITYSNEALKCKTLGLLLNYYGKSGLCRLKFNIVVWIVVSIIIILFQVKLVTEPLIMGNYWTCVGQLPFDNFTCRMLPGCL